jgi:hypothetical protein
MKRKHFHTALAAFACLGMVLPPGACATQPTSGARDVALRPGGLLVGQVVDAQGVAQAATAVSVQQGTQEVVRTTTDQDGIFAAQGLRGGQYQIVTTSGQSFCRLWAPNTAPPSAQDAVVVVTGQDVVRGQWGGGYVAGYGGAWLEWIKAHPYITAGVVAAAVAVPVAVVADDDNGPQS